MKDIPKNSRALISMTILAALVAGLILVQFAPTIIVAIIFAVVFVPINNWLTKKTKRKNFSITLTTLLSIFTILLPLTIVVWISVDQVEQMITDVNTAINTDSQFLQEDELIIYVNERLDSLTDGRVQISIEQVQQFALETAQKIGEGMLNFLTSTIGGIPQLVTNIIIFFYVFVALLGNYKKVLDFLRKLNPLGDDVSHLFLDRAQGMTNAMVKGQFVVAISQGVIGAVSLYIAGLGYFSFFALILSVLSLIPLGGGIITIPIGIIMILFGNISGGLIVLLTHFLIVTNIDNYIRPKLVPEEIALHPALTMISVFSGLALFGFLGIVVGPVILIIALTMLQIYIAVSSNDKTLKSLK